MQDAGITLNVLKILIPIILETSKNNNNIIWVIMIVGINNQASSVQPFEALIDHKILVIALVTAAIAKKKSSFSREL